MIWVVVGLCLEWWNRFQGTWNISVISEFITWAEVLPGVSSVGDTMFCQLLAYQGSLRSGDQGVCKLVEELTRLKPSPLGDSISSLTRRLASCSLLLLLLLGHPHGLLDPWSFSSLDIAWISSFCVSALGLCCSVWAYLSYNMCDPSSPTRDRTQAPRTGSMES